MESVHRSAIRSWIHEKINLHQYCDEWYNELSVLRNYNKKKISKFVSNAPTTTKKKHCGKKLCELISTEEYMEVDKECGLESMKCEHQEDVDLLKNFIPEGVDLTTLKLQEADLRKRAADPQYENLFYNSQKFINYPPKKIAGTDGSLNHIPHEPVVEPELVLMVQVFRPEKKSDCTYRPSLSRFPVFQVDQEFLVLGSQYLTELRDKIDCVSDKVIPGDFSECPNVEPTVTCKDLYKSGFFYFDDTFYNDMRDSDCRDYSEVIINWAASKNRGIGPFHTGLMEKTLFIDLNIQLGYPYVYVHQGDCEHLIVFSDLYVFTDHFPSNRNIYPLYLSFKPKKRVNCMVCHVHTAAWVVFDNDRLPENPFFFCKKCFFSFNYDKNDQKIGKFRAYHFIDRSALT